MEEFYTERLIIREANELDAKFIYKLLNNPTWIEHIGNRNIKTLEDAKKYIQNSLINSYLQNGHGMYIFIEKEHGKRMGLCGFLKRKELDFVDIGYAILPESAGKGYTFEAATAILNQSKFTHYLGITSEDNLASQRLLEKLGLEFRRTIQFGDYEEKSMLYSNINA